MQFQIEFLFVKCFITLYKYTIYIYIVSKFELLLKILGENHPKLITMYSAVVSKLTVNISSIYHLLMFRELQSIYLFPLDHKS